MDLAAALGEAFAWEQQKREEGYLGLCAPLCGVPVVPLTLRRLTLLLQAKSAFLHGRAPALEDTCLLLWIVSPEFRPADPDARALFLARVTAGPALADDEAMQAAIEDYLAGTFNDAPAAQVTAPGKEKEPMFCFQTNLVEPILEKYPWSLDQIMDAPLIVLYQLLRKIALRNDPKAVFMNRRSRKVRGDWLRAMNVPSRQMPSTCTDADKPDHDGNEKQPDE